MIESIFSKKLKQLFWICHTNLIPSHVLKNKAGAAAAATAAAGTTTTTITTTALSYRTTAKTKENNSKTWTKLRKQKTKVTNLQL